MNHFLPQLDTEYWSPWKECVARSGGSDGDIPEIVKSLICEVEERGLDVPSIYQKTGAKSSIREIIKSFDQLEEVDLSSMSIHVICNALREFLASLPGNGLIELLL